MAARLAELVRLFVKLGVISVGGPAAHIALMREEVVERRRWVSPEEFLDLVGATNLIPGPNSTELAIHIGRIRAGWRGLVVAGVCFIVPAALIVGALAAMYVRAGRLPEVQAVFYGLKPVVLAIVAVALWQLGRTAIRSPQLGALAALAVAAVAAGVHELVVLALCGVSAAALSGAWRGGRGLGAWAPIALPMAASGAASAVSLGQMFAVFFKAGALLFGSGYVLLAFLRADLVQRLGWLSESQLLDAVAIGQLTPGPVFTTATFVGFLLGGVPGAVVATVAIFLPAFVFVAVSAPWLPRLRTSAAASAVLDGVNVGSLALMAVVSAQLGRAALVDTPTVALAVVSVAALAARRVSSVWLLAVGAAVGLVKMFLG